MNQLSVVVAKRVRAVLLEQLEDLPNARAELRCFFQGPPSPFIDEIFEQLAREPIERAAQNGELMKLPVLLQAVQLPPDTANPAIGHSGVCDEGYLMSLRNSPDCRQYLVLVPPGLRRNLSISSASTEFGLSAASNSDSSTFEAWWSDPFVQSVVEEAIAAGGLLDVREDAHRLIEEGLSALESVDRQGSSRAESWNLIARLYPSGSVGEGYNANTALALSCGFPPSEGSFSASRDISVLERVAEELSEGFRSGVDRLRQQAADEQDQAALSELLGHLERRCDLLTAFERAPSAFYGPSYGPTLQEPPTWWRHLTVEKWSEILDGGDTHDKAGLTVSVLNPLTPTVKGGCAVVAHEIKLLVENDKPEEPVEVQVARVGARASIQEAWTVLVTKDAVVSDEAPPSHKAPLKYTTTSTGFKQASIKAISLETWSPGVYVTSRTAVKLTPTRAAKANKDKVDLEAFLDLTGSGRHYVDLFINSTLELENQVVGRDASGEELADDNLEGSLEKVSSHQFGLDIDVPGDCYLDVRLKRLGAKRAEVLRIHVTCADVVPASCSSEFEKAIALNTDERKARHDVYVDRQARCSDLQAWMLDPANVARSFMPVILADDCAENWAAPSWPLDISPIMSSGAFLHDPRPAPNEFTPPHDFLKLRAALAARIRGEDGNGLLESSALGEWMHRDISFSELVEAYLAEYMEWLGAEPTVAAWCDVLPVVSLVGEAGTLDQEPDAVLLSPLHPIRLAWHCAAQQVLLDAVRNQAPCPAASILDPDCVPDSFCLPLRSADGDTVYRPFISVEVNSDYWSVLWNGTRLGTLDARAQKAPFGTDFGIQVGGISSGFSSAQVVRALDDTLNMFSAKSRLGVLIASSPSNSDACTAGIVQWSKARWSTDEERRQTCSLGPSLLDVYDTRGRPEVMPGDTQISNLTEDTGGAVRWFSGRSRGVIPDIGIIAQLESSQPAVDDRSELKSPLGAGALIRHRIRKQLPGGASAFLSETRQGRAASIGGASLLGKVASAVVMLESIGGKNITYSFAPSVNAIRKVLGEEQAVLVAVSSSSVDPACFLGPWLEGAYLWDYDLPSFSRRAGDTNGYYLLSKIQDTEREGLRRALSRLPGAGEINDDRLRDTLLEISRRGIPTVRGISRGDTSGTGDLGMFVASRLLQDEFRNGNAVNSILRVHQVKGETTQLALVIPVDPFRGYLDDIARVLKKEKKDGNLSRPDLLVVGIELEGSTVRVRLTPAEVKCRQTQTMTSQACEEALKQARSLSALLLALRDRGRAPEMKVWELAFQHLLLSMIAFGMRVYSQRIAGSPLAKEWSKHHEHIASAVLSGEVVLQVDARGRLIVIDKSTTSGPRDVDGDGYQETIVLSTDDAAELVRGDPSEFYRLIRARVADWNLMPDRGHAEAEGIQPDPLISPSGQGATPMPAASPTGAHVEPVEHAPAEPPVIPEVEGSVGSPMPAQTPDASADHSDGVSLELGASADSFRPTTLHLNVSDTRLNQLNIGVVGDLGTGKTQLLKSLLYQMASSRANAGVKPRVLIFDYKKDYSSPDFVAAVGAKVVQPQNLPINIFDTTGLTESLTPWLDRFNFFADVLDKIYSNIGPVQRLSLKQAVRRAYEVAGNESRQPTIYDVHIEYVTALNGKADSPLAIIEDLVDRQVFTKSPGDSASFGKFFDGVVVVSLNALGQDDRAKNMVVASMLNMFYEHMLTIPKRPFRGTDPQLRVIDSYLLVDEADNIMKYEFDVLRKILLQGREFGVGVVLASQYLKHFKVNATDYREPLLTWFVHKVPNVTPQELSALGMTSDLVELAARVKSLPNHHCLYKSAQVAGEVINGLPFYKLLARN